MEERKIMASEELTKYINEMDPDEFALVVLCSRFWDWLKNPGEITKERAEKFSKKYDVPINSRLLLMLIAFLAGAEAMTEIESEIMTGIETEGAK